MSEKSKTIENSGDKFPNSGKNDDGKIDVIFVYVKTSKEVKFSVPKDMIFDDVLKIAYEKFDEVRKDNDHYSCKNGNALDKDMLGKKIIIVINTHCKSMMACMIFKSYNPIPYYVEPKKYGEAPDEPQSFGVKTIIPLPNYTIQQPNQNQIKALNIIKKSKKLNKKRFAELCINNKLFSTNNDKIGQNDYGKLNNQIITPLKNNWEYIKVEKIGHNDWITLTNSGNDVCKFLIEDVDITMSGIHN